MNSFDNDFVIYRSILLALLRVLRRLRPGLQEPPCTNYCH